MDAQPATGVRYAFAGTIHLSSQPSAPIADVGSGNSDGSACATPDQRGTGILLLWPPKPLATWKQREYQMLAAAIRRSPANPMRFKHFRRTPLSPAGQNEQRDAVPKITRIGLHHPCWTSAASQKGASQSYPHGNPKAPDRFDPALEMHECPRVIRRAAAPSPSTGSQLPMRQQTRTRLRGSLSRSASRHRAARHGTAGQE